MAGNLFDSIDGTVIAGDGAAPWAARSPFRPEADRDLMLVPRVRDWQADAGAREALDRIAADPAVDKISEHPVGVDVRLADDWIATRGEALKSGAPDPKANADLAAGERYAVYFWGANTTKALHVGHLRNLALGNAIAAGLRVGGARSRTVA